MQPYIHAWDVNTQNMTGHPRSGPSEVGTASCGRQLDDHIQRYGVRHCYELVTYLMDQLRDEPLNVAVLGQRRQNKQVFLSAICRNLAFNRGGLGKAISRRASHQSLQVPGNSNSNNSRLSSANSSSADLHCTWQTTFSDLESGDHEANGKLNKPRILLSASSSSEHGTSDHGVHSPTSTVEFTGFLTKQDEGVFLNDDVELPDAEVAYHASQQQVYAEENVSDIFTYCYPEFPDIRLWDIPDFDAEGYTRQTYEETVQQEMDFDAFLVTSGNRFLHQDDLFWAKLLQKEKNAVFVCTHLDREIKREKTAASQPQTKHQQEIQMQFCPAAEDNAAGSELAVFKQIHSYYRKKFFKHAMFGLPLFIVAPSEGMKFDFPDLTRLLLKWRQRKQRARKSRLLVAAQRAVSTKHRRHQAMCDLVSILCGLAAGLPASPAYALAGDVFLCFGTVLSGRSFGLDAADLEGTNFFAERDKEPPRSAIRTLVTSMPCTVMWWLRQVVGAGMSRATTDALFPDVVTTALSLVAVGGACAWSKAIMVSRLRIHSAQCRLAVDDIINRKLVTYLKETGDFGSSAASGTRSASPVFFSA